MAIRGELIVEKLSAAWLLRLRGEHDIVTAHNLDAQLEAVFVRGTNVIVDFSEAQFIDSSIVGAILRRLRSARTDVEGDLVVCAPPGSFARRVIDQASLTDVLRIADSRRDAIARFEPRFAGTNGGRGHVPT